MSKPRFVTPIGTVKFPQIEKPDQNGKYRISLVIDPSPEFDAMIAKVQEEEKNFEKKYRGKDHFKKNIDLINGEKVETDKILIQFNSAFPLWNEKETKLFDSKGTPIRTDIGWGSKCRVAFTLLPYDVNGKVGVTRYIAGIQVIELKTSTVTSDGCGFKVEDGYVSEPEEPKVKMDPAERQAKIDANEIAWDE